MKINFIKGDCTKPQGEGNKIIAHICNDIGAWGGGFVLAISKKWKEPEIEYRKWHKNGLFNNTDVVCGNDNDEKRIFRRGNVQFVKVDNNLWVGNMIGQKNIISEFSSYPPIRYESVFECLEEVVRFAIKTNSSVHMPKIGCGLAGGKWDKIEPIILETLVKNNVKTFVYDF